jgi:hypothetical protein
VSAPPRPRPGSPPEAGVAASRPLSRQRRPRAGLSRRLASGGAAIIALVVALVAAPPRPARAEAAGEAATVAELRRTVEDLQRRVRELERRLAAGPPAPNRAAETAPPPVPPAPAPAPPPPTTTAEAAPTPSPAPPAPAAATPAPGQVQVSKEAAATALERALVQRGAVLLPPRAVEIVPSLGSARREPNQSSLLVQNGQQPLASNGFQQRRNDLTAGLALRLGLPLASQLTLGIPYRHQDISFLSRSASGEVHDEGRVADGFGDLNVGLSKQLLREGGWRPDLVAAVDWDTDTGQRGQSGAPLGSGFDEVTAGLTASKGQEPLVFVGSLAYTHTFPRGGVGPGDVYGVSLGAALGASPETSLRFFLDASYVGREEVSGRGVAGSDDVVGLLRIGASSILSRRTLLDVDLGIGLTQNAPDFTLAVSLPIRFDLPLFPARTVRR